MTRDCLSLVHLSLLKNTSVFIYELHDLLRPSTDKNLSHKEISSLKISEKIFSTQKFGKIHRNTAESLFRKVTKKENLIEKATPPHAFFCEFCENLSGQVFFKISQGTCLST